MALPRTASHRRPLGHKSVSSLSSFSSTSNWAPWQAINDFEETQNKTFCKWLNTRLEPLGYPPLTDLGQDFCDGTRLIQLVEVLTDESLGRYNREPVMRVQKAENVIKALEKIKSMNVHLTNIGPEDIMDGNRKLILGMVWLLVLRFLIANIDEEGSHAKEGLLLWCQRRTKPYKEVDIKNFSRSWQDGLAFCALIHRHRPELIDYNTLSKDPSAAVENTRLAFQIAETHLGIPQLLDVEDVCSAKRPDEKSIMTYVAQFFHAFSSKAREETDARIINNFVDHMSSVIQGIHDYERRAIQFLDSIATLLDEWTGNPPQRTYSHLKSLQKDFQQHRLVTKREWVKEKGAVFALLGHIQTKLRTYGMRVYEPDEGLRLVDLDDRWQLMLDAEADRSRTINAMIRAIKEEARITFANLANEFEHQLQELTASLAVIDGELDAQQTQILAFQDQLNNLSSQLPPISQAEQDCLTCNVDENDYTIYSYDDLVFEYDQLALAMTSRKAFVDNQVVARSVTNVTPEQLEEFESAFRTFDKDGTNILDVDELVGALGSLGMSEQDVVTICQEAENSDGEVRVTFEAFIKFLVDRAEDRVTADKVRNTFRAVGGEKGFITELDLKRLHLPVSTAELLEKRMPKIQVEGGDLDDVDCFDFEAFLDALLE